MDIKSFGDIDSLKENDEVISASLYKENKSYRCEFDKFKIVKFLFKDKKDDNKYSVELERVYPENVILTEEEEKTKRVMTNLLSGFVPASDKEALKNLLLAFKEEFIFMEKAIDAEITKL